MIAVLALAGCSGQAGNTTKAETGPANAVAGNVAELSASAPATASTAAAAEPPADTKADEAAIRNAVTKLYASYNKPNGPDIDRSAAFSAAWDRAVGKDGVLDGDPFCQCQDYDKVSSTVRSVAIDGDHAKASVTITNFGRPSKIQLGFAREAGIWRVDDVFDERGKGMKAEMLAAKPDSWGGGEE